MATLKRTASSSLFEAGPASVQDSRFSWWPAQPLSAASVSLQEAWENGEGGVFVVAAEQEETRGLEIFSEAMWRRYGKPGSRLIAWKKGVQNEPPYLVFDKTGAYRAGTEGKGFLEITIGSSGSDERSLVLALEPGAAFSADADPTGDSIRLLLTAANVPFRLMLGRLDMDLAVKEVGGKKVFCRLTVNDTLPGSGSWEFEAAQTSTVDFLTGATPMIKFSEGSVNFQKFAAFDIAASKAALARVPLAFKFHPYVARASHASIRFSSTKLKLVSNFVDTAGRAVELNVSGSSQLRLQANTPAASPRFHLAPSGSFGVTFRPTASARVKNTVASVMEVLVGTAGTEYVQFGDGSSTDLPDAIHFVTDSPAYVNHKPAGQSVITAAVTTAWVAPVNSGVAQAVQFPYVGQAEEAPLFSVKPVIGNVSAETGLRDMPGMLFEPAAATVTNAAGPVPLPMIAVRDASPNAIAAARQLNARALVPRRREIAAKHRALLLRPQTTRQPNEVRWVVMPQGFSVALDASNRWQKVMFAAASGDVSADVVLDRPQANGVPVERWPVEESLSRPATFLVATRFPASMPEPGGDESLTPVHAHVSVGGWTVQVGIDATKAASAANERPILVVKLGGGSKFVDLQKDTTQWSLASVFNENPASTRDAIARTVDSIGKLVNGQSPLDPSGKISPEAKAAYKLLQDKLMDPDWNGVILFNGTNDPQALPEGVAALSAGLKDHSTPFWAPCIGLDLCKVEESAIVQQPQEAAPLPAQVPSIFAGVHYFDPKELRVDDLSFALKLRNLDVVLHNSTLKLFVAKADLRISGLLGAEVRETLADGGMKNRIVQIAGSYQGRSAEGADVYLIRAIGSQKIVMASEVIEFVELNRLELTSRREHRRIFGRIGLWGSIGFGSRVVDLTGLNTVRFENLAISLELEPGSDPKFKFDAGHVDVDWQQPATKAGLLDSFPLKLSGLTWGGADFSLPSSEWPKLPSLHLPDLGFSDLDLDKFSGALDRIGSTLDFGLELNLDMGSFGAMTDVAKLLKAKILFGWHDFRRPDVGSRWPQFAVGFKFEGGSGPLDIGIQGVLRLRAKKAILKKYTQTAPDALGRPGELLGIALDEPQLEVMGYKVPEDPQGVRVAVVVELGDSGSNNNLPTWVFAMPTVDAGPVFLRYFAIGQNVLLLEEGSAPSITSVTQAIEDSRKWMDDKFADEKLNQLRPRAPSSKWNVIADGLIRDNVADVKLVFLDDVPLYGLRVEAPISKPLFAIDILYKKIADDLGVFSVELDLKGLRTFELGAGSLTLPIFTFRKFTNGNWDLDFGFRYNDFSAAATLQILPFLGSGSTRFGQLSGQSGNFLLAGASPGMRDYYRNTLKLRPVYELQLAFRVGIGKEIRQGIFSAGASLSVYGIFQGALGTINHPKAQDRRYLKLAGAAGILLEVFGEVNFAVVSAAVCIRLWIETGMIVETWQPISIYAEAGVSVYVRFVIARIRIWSKTIEIAVYFSFSTTLRIGATLPVVLDNPPLIQPPQFNRPLLPTYVQSTCPAPIDWVAQKVMDETLEVVLATQFDAQVGDDNTPALLPMLALIDAHPQGGPVIDPDTTSQFVTLVLRWAVRLSLGLTANPESITSDDLRRLLARLRAPGKRALSRWAPVLDDGSTINPLDHSVIRRFFASNILFKVNDPGGAKLMLQSLGADPAGLADPQPLPGILMPWLRELQILAGKSERVVRDFQSATFEEIDEAWEIKLRSILAQGRPRLDALDPCESPALTSGSLAGSVDAAKKALLDILLEDWFACLVESGAFRALQIVDAEPNRTMLYAKLEAAFCRTSGDGAPAATLVAQQASAVLMHAMRAPDSGGKWMALSQRAGLELQVRTGEILASDTVLTVQAAKVDWIQAAKIPHEFKTTAGDARAHIEAVKAGATSKAVSLKVSVVLEQKQRNAVATHGTPMFLQDGIGAAGTMFQLPDDLAALLARRRRPGEIPSTAQPATLKGFGDFTEGKQFQPTLTVIGGDEKVRAGGIIKLALRRVSFAPKGTGKESGAVKLRGVYGVYGGGEAARIVLQSWKDALAHLRPDAFTLIWNPASGGVPQGSPASATRVISTGARFFVTNLSTETNPDLQVSADEDVDPGVVVADLANESDVREFLWKCALVNSTGFYLAIDETNAAAIDSIEAQLDLGAPAEIGVAWSRLAFKGGGAGELHPCEAHIFVDPQVTGDKLTVILDLMERRAGSGVPEGYVKLRIGRTNPVRDALADEEQREWLSRFAFVEYRVAASGLFYPLEFDECTPLPLEAPENDPKLSLTQQEPADVEHFVLIPLLNFAKSNRNASGHLPQNPDALNPYALVGEDIANVLSFGLRDAAGHRYPGTIARDFPSTRVVYREPLLALGSYPGVALDWTAAAAGPDGGKVSLTLRYAQPTRLLSGAELAASRQQFQRLAWMLRAPGMIVKAYVLIDDTPLAEHPEAEVLQKLKEFVQNILDGAPKPTTIDIEIKVADLVREVGIARGARELRVQLEMERKQGFFDEDLQRTDPAMSRVASVVNAAVNEQAGDKWAQFADNFEKAFASGGVKRPVYLVKLAGNEGSTSCWLFSGDALRKCLDATRSAASYAPLPLSRNFMSGDAELLDGSGSPPPSPLTKTVSDIDLDMLASKCFEFVEDVLAPAASAKMSMVSKDSFNSILLSKAKIVAAYEKRLSRVESESKDGPLTPEHVKARFTAAAATSLRRIYELGAICSISTDPPINTGAPATHRLYGAAKVIEAENPDSFEMSNMRVDLGGKVGSALSVFWKGSRKADAVRSKGLRFEPQFLECQWPGAGGRFIPSRWFELLSMEARRARDVIKGKFVVPLPLRRLPATPNVFGHRSVSTYDVKPTLQQARRWNYMLDTAAPGEDQDRVTYRIRYDPTVSVRSARNVRSVFDALVTFEHYQTRRTEDLSTLLGWQAGTDAAPAAAASERLARFVADVADSLGVDGQQVAQDVDPKELVDQFVVTLRQTGRADNLAVEGSGKRYELKIECEAAAGTALQRRVIAKLDDISVSPPAHVVPSGGVDAIIDEPSKNKAASSTFVGADRAAQGVAGLVGRSLEFISLDLFQHATATPEIVATRNEKLGGLEISPSFVLTTGVAKAERLVPRLRFREVLHTPSGKMRLQDHVAAIAKDLFADARHALSVDAVATFTAPYGEKHVEAFGYPLGAMKGVQAGRVGEWEEIFRRWGSRLELELLAKALGAKPRGVDLAIAVYAEGYAGSKPVLVIDKIRIKWADIAMEKVSLGFVPPKSRQPADLAGLLFGLTRGLVVSDSASQTDVRQTRERIASLLKAQVPTLNDVDRVDVPSAADLRDPAVAEAWQECAQLAAAAFERTDGLDLPLIWALEPSSSPGGTRPLALLDTVALLGSKARGFRVESGAQLTLARTRHGDIYEGEVKLMFLVAV